MCLFVTAVLPKEADVKLLTRIAAPFRRTFSPLQSPVGRYLDDSEAYFLTTSGYCDCGTSFGSALKSDLSDHNEEDRKTASLRRLGWSEAKIERSRSDREERRRRRDSHQKAAILPDSERWIGFITSVLREGLYSYIGLMVHQYEMDFEQEDFPVVGRIRHDLGALTPEFIATLSRDTIHVFLPGENSNPSIR